MTTINIDLPPLAVICCGGRDFDDAGLVDRVLQYLTDGKSLQLVIHGHAQGADTLAERWVQQHPYLISVPVPACWHEFRNSAGPYRNTHMAQMLLAYRERGWRIGVVAFPGGSGTANMMTQAKNLGIPVWEVTAGTLVERYSAGVDHAANQLETPSEA